MNFDNGIADLRDTGLVWAKDLADELEVFEYEYAVQALTEKGWRYYSIGPEDILFWASPVNGQWQTDVHFAAITAAALAIHPDVRATRIVRRAVSPVEVVR